jgi:SpoVK/Ycf46/Vps4 family AAA+-type ATPase
MFGKWGLFLAMLTFLDLLKSGFVATAFIKYSSGENKFVKNGFFDFKLKNVNKQNIKEDISKNDKKSANIESESFSFFLPLNEDKNLKKPDSSNLLNFLLPGLESLNKGKKKEDRKLSETYIQNKKYREGLINGIPLDCKISDLDSLINLCDSEKITEDENIYNIDLKSLSKMKPSLIKLKNMIGMESVKKNIVYQIIFYLQGLDISNNDMLHTVIEGKPGVGKTELAKILAEIYNSLGILSKSSFTVAKRSDLIGSYLGSTAMKTNKILEESLGGVLFIDEAYSLGNEEGKDIYSKECIDTINQFLSENREDFICIIAGYKESLEKCFFKYNPGLERRFPWRYSIKEYSWEELSEIFKKIVKDNSWKAKIEPNFFKDNLDKFKFFGGDLEILFQKTKLIHGMRAINLTKDKKRIINDDDLKGGLQLFLEDKDKKLEFLNKYMMYS